ncbi:MAG: protoporphyrinogen oxidase [Chloroflexi bacterium]|nr:protoporphyrinogen oxidase [Chloroflexota bacterium]
MARLLIVYGTSEGQTARIAGRIAAVVRDRGHEVALLDVKQTPRDLALAGYDIVAIGASVHAGHYPGAVGSFITKHVVQLRDMPTAFYSVSLTAASAKPEERAEAERLARAFVTAAGWEPARLVSFAGALPYTRYNRLMRWFMSRMARSGGSADTDTSRDYEYTDWAAVERFAIDLLALPASTLVASA